MAESMSDEADALREIKQEKPDSQLNTDRSKECSSTPPSSPPVLKPEALETARLSPSRKRSQEEMNAEAESANESSMTIVDEIDRSARQNQPTAKEVDSSATKMSSAHAHSMPPPPAPASIKLPPSQKPSRSGQGSQNTQNSQSQMREPEKTTQSANETLDGNSSKDDAMNDYTESSESLVTGDPKVKIEDFNWRNLQERYHAKMKELNATEHNILAEFENLCNYFSIWAQTGSNREVDRSFKRLKTQMTLVQYHEDELEQKRLHYIKVVEAFRSALQLLTN